MRTIQQYLPEHPFFAGLDDDAIALMVGCARNEHARPGQFLFREGADADRFYVVRHGLVALEVHRPAGGSVVVDTVGDGEVLGWSWLVPPHRWMFDARAIGETSLVSLDGLCLRGKCEGDPRLGYALLQRVCGVMFDRLMAARVRMLDLYGKETPVRAEVPEDEPDVVDF